MFTTRLRAADFFSFSFPHHATQTGSAGAISEASHLPTLVMTTRKQRWQLKLADQLQVAFEQVSALETPGTSQ